MSESADEVSVGSCLGLDDRRGRPLATIERRRDVRWEGEFLVSSSDVNQALDYLIARLQERERRQIYERAFRPQYFTIAAELPEVGRNRQCPLFSFGVPAGWAEMTAGAMNTISNFTVLAGVTTVGSAAFFVGDVGLQQDEEHAFALLAYPDELYDVRQRTLNRAQPTWKYGPPTRHLIGGQRSILFQFNTQVPGEFIGLSGIIPVTLIEMFMPLERRILTVTFSTPQYQCPSLLPAFRTMLALWRWGS